MSDAIRIGRLNGGFVVTWWEGEKRRRYRLNARSRATAETEAIEVFERSKLENAPGTIETLWEMYRTEKIGRRIAQLMDYEWRSMRSYFGHLVPEQLTIETCRVYSKARSKAGIHDGTIWTELGHLRTVLNWAYARRLITFAPPIERPAKPSPKDRWLTTAEIQKLIAAPGAPHVRLAILLLLATAGRVTAILELSWDRVDFANGTINLRKTETGPRKGRAIVPMSDGLRRALSAAREVAITDYVIEWAGEPIARLRTGFAAAVKSSGLKGVTPHVLRHTAAVHLVAAGIPMQKVSQYLGHSSIAVTERVYGRFAPDHLRAEAAILDFSNPSQSVP